MYGDATRCNKGTEGQPPPRTQRRMPIRLQLGRRYGQPVGEGKASEYYPCRGSPLLDEAQLGSAVFGRLVGFDGLIRKTAQAIGSISVGQNI